MQAIRCLVTGRVQGVGFRAATARRARGLGIEGHARNLEDGRVEVLARGGSEALAELVRWLWQGPAFAHVSEVALEEAAPTDDTFTVGAFTTE
ncbi:MAG: acylphosphatase [Gammaproteobacteria bacterium]|nr:acylphosphatase [Gammaproteobacteria bacterium]TVQ46710.1 MAG: acylphosphatase [Gammaproteobacteria bacterium]